MCRRNRARGFVLLAFMRGPSSHLFSSDGAIPLIADLFTSRTAFSG
jgi:hypothetical protein